MQRVDRRNDFVMIVVDRLQQKVKPHTVRFCSETPAPESQATLSKQVSCKLTTKGYDTHTRLTALCPGLPGWAGTRKVKPIWILLKQETVSGSEIRRAICKSAPCSRQISTPAPHRSVFYRPDALPAAQPTESKH